MGHPVLATAAHVPTKPSAPGDAFALTLRDVFSNTYNVDVSSKTTVFEVKEKLRVANGEPIEYVDAVALLYNQLLLHDDSTLGSLGMTESTTVMAVATFIGRLPEKDGIWRKTA